MNLISTVKKKITNLMKIVGMTHRSSNSQGIYFNLSNNRLFVKCFIISFSPQYKTSAKKDYLIVRHLTQLKMFYFQIIVLLFEIVLFFVDTIRQDCKNIKPPE